RIKKQQSKNLPEEDEGKRLTESINFCINKIKIIKSHIKEMTLELKLERNSNQSTLFQQLIDTLRECDNLQKLNFQLNNYWGLIIQKENLTNLGSHFEKCIKKLQSLKLDFDPIDNNAELLELILQNIANLQSLYIKIYETSFDNNKDLDSFITSQLAKQTQLKELTIYQRNSDILQCNQNFSFVLAQMTQLKLLNLRLRKCEDQSLFNLFSALKHCTELNSLSIDLERIPNNKCDLKVLSSGLEKCTKLHELHLHLVNAEIFGDLKTLSSAITKSTQLEKLNLNLLGNQIKVSFMDFSSDLKNCILLSHLYLDLRYNEFNDYIFPLEKCSNLQYMEFYFEGSFSLQQTASLFTSILNNSNIQTLNTDSFIQQEIQKIGLNFLMDFFKVLSSCENLQKINLRCRFDKSQSKASNGPANLASSLTKLSKLSDLEIDLHNNQVGKGASVWSSLASLQQLKIFDIKFRDNLVDGYAIGLKGLQSILSNLAMCLNLQDLKLSLHNTIPLKSMSDIGIILASYPNLEKLKLDLPLNTFDYDSAHELFHFIAQCPRLKYFMINSQSKYTDIGDLDCLSPLAKSLYLSIIEFNQMFYNYKQKITEQQVMLKLIKMHRLVKVLF
ncbi:hypothetical protein ABPG74_021159, partial [Tetrahymena malaccensis]